jgi:hypothetical protein
MDVTFKDVSRSFKKVARMIAKHAKANGIDMDAIAKEAAATPAHGMDRAEVREHPLCREGNRYFTQCHDLLEKLRPVFNADRDDAAGRAQFMDVGPEADGLARVRDACEVLSWDCSLVYVKTVRTMDGVIDAKDETGDAQEISLHDARGTAAVALRCLARDKAALLTIYEWDKDFQDAAIGLLACAEGLLRAIKDLVPGCTDFVWPPPEAHAKM